VVIISGDPAVENIYMIHFSAGPRQVSKSRSTPYKLVQLENDDNPLRFLILKHTFLIMWVLAASFTGTGSGTNHCKYHLAIQS
jgi:hypothetical protein